MKEIIKFIGGFYEKKILSIFLLFSILTYGAGHIEEISQLRAIRSNKEKIVSLTGFPSDFENTLEGLLENELGWKTSNTNNSFSIEGFDIHFNESEKYKGYEGIIRFTDLRTGKEFARYKFRIAEPDNVQKEIVKILESLPGA